MRLKSNGVGFPLSQRERDGVRENASSYGALSIAIPTFLLFVTSCLATGTAAEIFIRASQASYQAKDSNLAIAFSQEPLP